MVVTKHKNGGVKSCISEYIFSSTEKNTQILMYEIAFQELKLYFIFKYKRNTILILIRQVLSIVNYESKLEP